MIRTLILSTLLALLTACGGDDSPPDNCMAWQGQPVPCEASDAASAPGGV
jgi:hypothetical protein